MKPLVIYHANCADGFCAAWAARRKLGDCDFYPAHYNQSPPNVAGRDVYILDFSYPRHTLLIMNHEAASLLVLDHHKSAQAALDGLDFCRFDMSKSGGRLAWEHFCPDEPASFLVNYTEDRDLWLWKIPDSKEMSAGIRSYPFDFERWDGWHDFAALTMDDLIKDGRAILRYQQEVVNQAVRNANEIEMDGHKILAVNSTILFSEIAGELAKGRPFGAAWFIRQDGKKQWSLRSADDGIDVSEIATRHGGGGHRNASGYEENV